MLFSDISNKPWVKLPFHINNGLLIYNKCALRFMRQANVDNNVILQMTMSMFSKQCLFGMNHTCDNFLTV